MKKFYYAYGLIIASDIHLAMIELEQSEYNPDVHVIYGKSDIKFEGTLIDKGKFKLSKDRAIIPINEEIIMYINNGREICIDNISNIEEDIIAQYILNSGLMVILQQREIYPVHGTSINCRGNSIIICGEPHAGKSSLAHTFESHGYTILSDDLTAVDIKQEPLKTFQGHLMQRFWDDTLHHFGIEEEKVFELHNANGKKAVVKKNSEQIDFEGHPIKAIIELSIGDVEEPTLNRVKVTDGMGKILKHTYRRAIYDIPELLEGHFARAALIAMNIPVYQLKRPKKGYTSEAQFNEIMNNIIDINT